MSSLYAMAVTHHPLSVTQAALLYDVPRRTVQYAISTGRLPAHKLPGQTGAYLIDRTDLESWVRARRSTRRAS